MDNSGTPKDEAEVATWRPRPLGTATAGLFLLLLALQSTAAILEAMDGDWGGAASTTLMGLTWLAVFAYDRPMRLKYVLTSNNLVIRRGYLGRDTTEIPLVSIGEVVVYQSDFGKRFSFGDLSFVSSVTGNHRLEDVPDPHGKKASIEKAASAAAGVSRTD